MIGFLTRSIDQPVNICSLSLAVLAGMFSSNFAVLIWPNFHHICWTLSACHLPSCSCKFASLYCTLATIKHKLDNSEGNLSKTSKRCEIFLRKETYFIGVSSLGVV